MDTNYGLMTEIGEEFGAAAFAAGIHAAPALDREFLAFIGSLGLPIGGSLPALKGWSRAWHRANLAAPLSPL